MINLIVKFLEIILSLAAGLIVVVFGIGGFALTQSRNFDTLAAFIAGGFGMILGFIVAAITLGIPMLLLQINRNLESINSQISDQSSHRSGIPYTSESFFTVPPKTKKPEP